MIISIILILFILLIFYISKKIIYEFYENSNNKKIAFMFLIYDEINHEDIWKLFFKNIDSNKYNIYIHYKNYKKSEYFDKYKLKNIIPTAWYHISLVKAHNLLLKEALKDPDNAHFILLSNSCLPFKNFMHIYNNLNPDYSYYNMFNYPHYERCQNALKYISINHIRKAHQWSILNRKHTSLIVNNDFIYIDWFINCPDEHSHISYLVYKNLDNELIKTQSAKYDAKTFTNWNNEGTQLHNYDIISDEELLLLINSPCFFGRKFTKNCKNLNLLYNFFNS